MKRFLSVRHTFVSVASGLVRGLDDGEILLTTRRDYKQDHNHGREVHGGLAESHDSPASAVLPSLLEMDFSAQSISADQIPADEAKSADWVDIYMSARFGKVQLRTVHFNAHIGLRRATVRLHFRDPGIEFGSMVHRVPSKRGEILMDIFSEEKFKMRPTASVGDPTFIVESRGSSEEPLVGALNKAMICRVEISKINPSMLATAITEPQDLIVTIEKPNSLLSAARRIPAMLIPMHGRMEVEEHISVYQPLVRQELWLKAGGPMSGAGRWRRAT